MTLLAVDTSGPSGSLGLAKIESGKLTKFFAASWDKKASHSEVATLELSKLLSDANVPLTDITHLAINIGPGSFTGLRVGISLVRTFAYAKNLPVLKFNRLEVLAFKNSSPGEKIFLATKAVQNFYYAAGYERLANGVQELFAPQSLDLAEVEKMRESYTKVLIEGHKNSLDTSSNARDLVELFLIENELRTFSAWVDVKPLYIRASEAEEKLRRGLLKPL